MPIPDQSSLGNNSSTTALSGGATFTGISELNDAPDVGVSCRADADGTLFFDFSNDGTNWDTFPVAGFAVAAGIHEFHTAVKLGRYFRVRLVNGSSAQTYLRLYTYFGHFRQANAPINQAISEDSDAALVRVANNFGYEVTRGRVSGYGTIEKFGYNADVDAATAAEDIWAGGGTYTGMPAGVPSVVAETVQLFSSSTADTAAGTGARKVTIRGLDENGDEASEEVTLNGTTPVTTTSRWFRGPRGYVSEAGSGETNAGLITCRMATTTANVFFTMPAGQGQTEVAAWTVPAGQQALLVYRQVEALNNQGSAQEVQCVIAHRPYNEGANSAWRFRRRLTASTVGGQVDDNIPFGILLGSLDDVKERAITATADNIAVDARFSIIYF